MTKPLDPPAALRPLDAIRADLEHPHTAALLAVRVESVGDAPIGRLLRDVGPLVAEVERLRDGVAKREGHCTAEAVGPDDERVSCAMPIWHAGLHSTDRTPGVGSLRWLPLSGALAASPTPTGPEPATKPNCTRPGWCACDPLTPGDEHCQWFGPATPEPTEETP